MVHHGQGLHGIIDWFPLQQTWSTAIAGSSTTWWSEQPTGQNHFAEWRLGGFVILVLNVCLHWAWKRCVAWENVFLYVVCMRLQNKWAESKQLTLSCEHFDVDGTLDTDLLTDLWSRHLLLGTPGTKAVTELFQHAIPRCCLTDLRKDLWSDVWLGVEEVQNVAWMLDAVFGRLFWGGEPVVPGAMEVLETTCAIF